MPHRRRQRGNWFLWAKQRHKACSKRFCSIMLITNTRRTSICCRCSPDSFFHVVLVCVYSIYRNLFWSRPPCHVFCFEIKFNFFYLNDTHSIPPNLDQSEWKTIATFASKSEKERETKTCKLNQIGFCSTLFPLSARYIYLCVTTHLFSVHLLTQQVENSQMNLMMKKKK